MVRVLSFQLNDELVGLRLDQVNEVVRVGDHVRMLGGAPQTVRGLMDVRGRVVTLLDTPVILGHPEGREQFGMYAAVLHEPGKGVGFVLPEKMEILELDEENLSDEANMDPFLEGVLGYGSENSEDAEQGFSLRISILSPEVILETCRDEVRSRFLTRKTL